MNIPITIVGVGAGFGYHDSGPTHHAVEDLAIMRILPHMTVWNSSSDSMAAYCARQIGKGLNYIRLDRENLPEIHYKPAFAVLDMDKVFEKGYIVHKEHGDRVIVTTGNMVHTALEVAKEVDIGVIEIFRIPPQRVLGQLRGKDLYVIEENNKKGGLLAEIGEIVGHRINSIYSRSVDLRDGYDYIYGGRSNIQKHYGLDKESIIQWLK